MSHTITPLLKQTLADNLAQELKKFIVKKGYYPGHKLPSTSELAQRFGVGLPTLREAVKKLEAIGEAEIKKTVQSLGHLSDKDRKALYRMKTAMINKLLHDPTMFLKNSGDPKKVSNYIDITRKLFNLDD